MKSILIRTSEDFDKIDEETEELEFVEFNEVFTIDKCHSLSAITFTKMYVDMDVIPRNVNKLCLFDCDGDIDRIVEFGSLKHLEITNRNIDILAIAEVQDLEVLSLNFCEIKNPELLENFSSLKEISLVDTNINDFSFLKNLSSLKKIIISDEEYESMQEVFVEFGKNGIDVYNMMGGNLNEI